MAQVKKGLGIFSAGLMVLLSNTAPLMYLVVVILDALPAAESPASA